jgi:hypothetical protein
MVKRWVEIRSYNLKEGGRDEFHRLVVQNSIPMLARWEVDVVAFGPSTHDESSYYLIRAYDSLADREASQDAFYSSDEWRQGPREAIIALIESHTSIVIEMEAAVADLLRGELPTRPTI